MTYTPTKDELREIREAAGAPTKAEIRAIRKEAGGPLPIRIIANLLCAGYAFAMVVTVILAVAIPALWLVEWLS